MYKDIKIFLAENKTIMLISIIIALFFSIIINPGIVYSDTCDRIYVSEHIIYLYKNLYNQPVDLYETCVQILPSVFIALCRMFKGGFLLYIFIKAFLYLFFSFLFIKNINVPFKPMQYALFCLNPVIMFVCVWDAPDVFCASCIAICIVILMTKYNNSVLKYVSLLFVTMCLFGYRPNAMTILPIIFLFIIFYRKDKIIEKFIKIFIIVFSILYTYFLLPYSYNVKQFPVCVTGQVWEMLYVLHNKKESLSQEQKVYLDDISSDKCTQANLDKVNISKNNYNYIFDNVNFFLWEDNCLNISVLYSEGKTAKIFDKYINIIKTEPYEYAKNKIYFVKRVLGINKPLNVWAFDCANEVAMGCLCFKENKNRYLFKQIFDNSASRSLIRYPYLLFLLSFILLISEIIRNSKNKKLYLLLYILALSYYSGFLITTLSFEIRYFFPSYYLMTIMNITIFANWLNLIYKKISNKS